MEVMVVEVVTSFIKYIADARAFMKQKKISKDISNTLKNKKNG